MMPSCVRWVIGFGMTNYGEAEIVPRDRRKKEHDFKSWRGPGPNSDKIVEIGAEWAPEMKQNIRNPYQTEDNKNPRGRREAPLPWEAPKAPLVVFHLVCQVFLCFATFPEPNLGRFSEFGPGPIQDLKIVFFFSPNSLRKSQQHTPILYKTSEKPYAPTSPFGEIKTTKRLFSGPKGPLGPERSDFLRGPKAPRAPWVQRASVGATILGGFATQHPWSEVASLRDHM